MSNDPIELYVQRQIVNPNPELVSHQPQSCRVLAAYKDLIAIESMDKGRVFHCRSTGLSLNGCHRIIEGLGEVPDPYNHPSSWGALALARCIHLQKEVEAGRVQLLNKVEPNNVSQDSY